MEILVVLAVSAIVAAVGFGALLIGLAWTHYPQGIIKAWLDKRKRSIPKPTPCCDDGSCIRQEISTAGILFKCRIYCSNKQCPYTQGCAIGFALSERGAIKKAVEDWNNRRTGNDT